MSNETPSQSPADAAPASPPPAFTPVPRKHKRHDGWTPERQRAFIDALSDTGSVKAAARTVTMSSESAYHLRRQPGAEEFAAAWAAALAHRIELLRDAAMERAIHGVEVPVYSYGKLIGSRIVYNDRLATFMLRNYDGHMAGGASGLPLRLQRVVEEEVEKAREEWEEERRRDYEEAGLRVREEMDLVRERLRAAGRIDWED